MRHGVRIGHWSSWCRCCSSWWHAGDHWSLSDLRTGDTRMHHSWSRTSHARMLSRSHLMCMRHTWMRCHAEMLSRKWLRHHHCCLMNNKISSRQYHKQLFRLENSNPPLIYLRATPGREPIFWRKANDPSTTERLGIFLTTNPQQRIDLGYLSNKSSSACFPTAGHGFTATACAL